MLKCGKNNNKNRRAGVLVGATFLITICAIFITPRLAQAFTFGDDQMAFNLVSTAANYNIEYSYLNTGEKLYVKPIYMPNKQRTGATENFSTIVHAPDGQLAGTCQIADGAVLGDYCEINITASQAGIYKIFTDNDIRTGINYEILVSDAADAEITGRTWTNQLTLEQQCSLAEDDLGLCPSAANFNSVDPNDYPLNTRKDISLYAVNDAGDIYQADLWQFQGYSSTIKFDSVGNAVASNSCTSAYISQGNRQDIPLDPPRYVPASNCTKYRLFFEAPNADLPASALSADGVVQILPVQAHSPSTALADLEPVLDINNLINNLSFNESLTAANKAGVLAFDMNANFAGNYTVQVDVNNDGDYDDVIDRAFNAAAPGGASNSNISVNFDGKDGQGGNIAPGQTIRFRVKFDRIAEVHFVVYDVEGMGGLTLKLLNGVSAGTSTIYWDDTKLVQYTDGTTYPWSNSDAIIDGRGGVVSDTPGGVHGWSLINTNPANGRLTVEGGWGDNRAIDNWAYLPTDVASNLSVAGGPHYVVNFISNGGAAVAQQKVAPGGVATDETTDRYDYIFEGWYVDAALTTPYDFSTLINSDITLYAKWTAVIHPMVPSPTPAPATPSAPDAGLIAASSFTWTTIVVGCVVILINMVMLLAPIYSKNKPERIKNAKM
jgi:uncharacterized repeat protein (TIGR02543 family)